MRLNIVKSANAEQLYIIKSFRKEDGKSTTRIFKKLGTMASLLPLHDNDRDKVISWAKEQARIYTEAEKNENMKICLELSEGRHLMKSIPLTEDIFFFRNSFMIQDLQIYAIR